MSTNTVAPTDNKIQIDPQYFIQALETSLTEVRQQNLMLTALVNQQQAEITELRSSDEDHADE